MNSHESNAASEFVAAAHAKRRALGLPDEPEISAAISRHDPPVRADGRCYVCLAERKPPKGKRDANRYRSRITAKKPAVDVTAMVEGDPFCSTECCKAYHGVVMASGTTQVGRPRVMGSVGVS